MEPKFFLLLAGFAGIVAGIITIIFAAKDKKIISVGIGALIVIAGCVCSGCTFLIPEKPQPPPEETVYTMDIDPDINLGPLNDGNGFEFISGSVSYTGLIRGDEYIFRAYVKTDSQTKTFEKTFKCMTNQKFEINYEIDTEEFGTEKLKVDVDVEHIEGDDNDK